MASYGVYMLDSGIPLPSLGWEGPGRHIYLAPCPPPVEWTLQRIKCIRSVFGASQVCEVGFLKPLGGCVGSAGVSAVSCWLEALGASPSPGGRQ